MHDASGVYRPRQPANPSSGTAGRLPYHQGKTQATASNIDGDADGPKRLKWHLTPSTVAAIRAAEAHSDKTIAATDLQVGCCCHREGARMQLSSPRTTHRPSTPPPALIPTLLPMSLLLLLPQVYQTPSLTKADIKRSGLSPDGVMQMVGGGLGWMQARQID